MNGWKERLQWSLGPGILAGIDLPSWRRLLRENQWSVDARFTPRAYAITTNAVVNTALKRREARLYGDRIRAAEVRPPLFILGHWRSGTTYLHYLLSTDKQFASPNVYQTSFPHSFLTAEVQHSKLLGGLLPNRRPMDEMKLGFDTPNEDEFAICAMSLLSPYLCWVFPRHASRFDRYLTLEHAEPGEVELWKDSLLTFIRKMACKDERPLVLKSPTHTCRIRLLLSLFPDARFIHIHRHPHAVFQSTLHTIDKMLGISALQRSDGMDWSESAIRQYRAMFDRFFKERPLIPDNRFCEVRYDDLDRDPERQVDLIYEKLGMTRTAEARAALRTYLDCVQGYRKNRFDPLPEQKANLLYREWERCFDAWGYEASPGLARV